MVVVVCGSGGGGGGCVWWWWVNVVHVVSIYIIQFVCLFVRDSRLYRYNSVCVFVCSQFTPKLRQV